MCGINSVTVRELGAWCLKNITPEVSGLKTSLRRKYLCGLAISAKYCVMFTVAATFVMY